MHVGVSRNFYAAILKAIIYFILKTFIIFREIAEVALNSLRFGGFFYWHELIYIYAKSSFHLMTAVVRRIFKIEICF